MQKLLTFFQQNTCELDIVLTRAVNILTTNELIKLTMLWTSGPWTPYHICPEDLASSFYHLFKCLKISWMCGKQCRPWSGSTLFAHSYPDCLLRSRVLRRLIWVYTFCAYLPKLFAQNSRFVASDLGLHCLLRFVCPNTVISGVARTELFARKSRQTLENVCLQALLN